MNGRNAGISARLLAPAGVLASSPNATVSQVSAIVSMMNTPVAAIQATGLAEDRNPISTATPTTRIPLISVRNVLPITWPVSTEALEMAMVRNLAMMPSVMSLQTLIAVVSAENPAVITKMPGVRKSI